MREPTRKCWTPPFPIFPIGGYLPGDWRAMIDHAVAEPVFLPCIAAERRPKNRRGGKSRPAFRDATFRQRVFAAGVSQTPLQRLQHVQELVEFRTELAGLLGAVSLVSVGVLVMSFTLRGRSEV